MKCNFKEKFEPKARYWMMRNPKKSGHYALLHKEFRGNKKKKIDWKIRQDI